MQIHKSYLLTLENQVVVHINKMQCHYQDIYHTMASVSILCRVISYYLINKHNVINILKMLL